VLSDVVGAQIVLLPRLRESDRAERATKPLAGSRNIGAVRGVD
jgi:hypothetical protein